ncbi:MAG TPA: biotin--[acetyl-CoA-carboxylase] ligase [Acidimicrobiales bacterium]|nr:biotin--[acetyl-CoA-carboxylase] ligase [Acidimicrobiales bacterium]
MILDERVRAALAVETRFHDIRFLESADSTNQLVARLAAEGAPEGLVVAADFQTAGRGRLDRTWDARPGDGLLVSVLLRPVGLPVDRWHLVTAAVALAAQAACADVAGVEPDIKWPNDLLAGDRKLAGILAEAAGGAVTVGMGLNVHGGPPGAAVLDELAGRRVRREDLLVAWLRDLDRRAADWHAVGEDYRRRCATVGRQVSVHLGDGQRLDGRAESVDDLGRLVVAGRHLAVGDVTHLR